MTLILDGTNGVTYPNSSTQSAGFYGFKNRIINGAMVIDQRNAGASVTPTANTYTLDRWSYVCGGVASKFAIQQNAGAVTPPAGFTKYLGLTSQSAYSISATDRFFVQQPVEGVNIADLAWGTANAKTITVSAWVYSSLTGTFGGSIQNSAQTRSYPFTYTIAAANTWTPITVTIPGDQSGTWLTDSNLGLNLLFGLGIGSTYSGTAGAWAGANYLGATGAVSVVGTNAATFYITGVQLEKANTASSFDYRPYGTELALCQRYLPAFSGSGYVCLGMMANNTTSCYGYYPFSVVARVTPTGVTVSSLAHFKGNGVTTDLTTLSALGLTAPTQYGTMLALTGTGGTANQFTSPYSVSASGQLLFTGCEL